MPSLSLSRVGGRESLGMGLESIDTHFQTFVTLLPDFCDQVLVCPDFRDFCTDSPDFKSRLSRLKLSTQRVNFSGLCLESCAVSILVAKTTLSFFSVVPYPSRSQSFLNRAVLTFVLRSRRLSFGLENSPYSISLDLESGAVSDLVAKVAPYTPQLQRLRKICSVRYSVC